MTSKMTEENKQRPRGEQIADEVFNKVGRDLSDLGEKVLDAAGKFADKVDEKLAKFDEKLDKAGEAFGEKYKEVTSSGLYRMFTGATKKLASKGKDAVKSRLEDLATKYQSEMDAQLETHPKVVGAIDGYYQILTGNKVSRSKKQAYVEGYGMGKVLGTAASAYLLVFGGVKGKLVGAVPLISRFGKKAVGYAKETYVAAKAAVDEKNPQ